MNDYAGQQKEFCHLVLSSAGRTARVGECSLAPSPPSSAAGLYAGHIDAAVRLAIVEVASCTRACLERPVEVNRTGWTWLPPRIMRHKTGGKGTGNVSLSSPRWYVPAVQLVWAHLLCCLSRVESRPGVGHPTAVSAA